CSPPSFPPDSPPASRPIHAMPWPPNPKSMLRETISYHFKIAAIPVYGHTPIDNNPPVLISPPPSHPGKILYWHETATPMPGSSPSPALPPLPQWPLPCCRQRPIARFAAPP